MRKLLTHPDRNGIVYTLDRTDGSLVSANKIDDTVNVFKSVDLKTGTRYATRNTAPGWTTSPRTSVPRRWATTTKATIPTIRSVSLLHGHQHICMDWEPFMLPYRAGQFFVGATLNMYPGPKGDRQNYEGLGQIKSYNAITGKFNWEKMERFAVWGGTTATAGNIVLYGTLDGFIKARDSDNGDLLWKFKLPSGAIGYPITYPTRARSYVAINYGVGGWRAWAWCSTCRIRRPVSARSARVQEARQLHQMGGGVIVFSLDGKGPYDDPNVGEYQQAAASRPYDVPVGSGPTGPFPTRRPSEHDIRDRNSCCSSAGPCARRPVPPRS